MTFSDGYKHKRVTVMGLGSFGGGVGVTRWLCEQGAIVTVTDSLPESSLESALGEIEGLIASGNVKLCLGSHRDTDFTSTDLVVANPAVPTPWSNAYLRLAADAGVPISTEIRLVCERLPTRASVVGVTGSAGKSTVAAMTAHLLRSVLGEDRVVFGGNIGGSLLARVASLTAEDAVVLELSSAMLYWLGRGVGEPKGWNGPGWKGFSPSVGVLTNIADNHADWHGSFEHYASSKLNIFRFGDTSTDAAIVAESSATMQGRFGSLGVRPRLVGLDIDTGIAGAIRAVLTLPGDHNVLNGVTAVAAVQSLLTRRGGPSLSTLTSTSAADPLSLASSLADFRGLPHRLEYVTSRGGVRYFNDSKSTTPQSCLLALRAFDQPSKQPNIHLIAGGYDKHSDLTPVADAAGGLAGLYTVGVTGPALHALAQARFPERVFSCGSLHVAVQMASQRAREGDIILLSPACASWDQFKNYEARGERFCELALAMPV